MTHTPRPSGLPTNLDLDPVHWARATLDVLGKALQRLWGRDVMLYVGGVSFWIMLAVFPLLVIAVGLYGILYLEVARMPEHGWLLAAVGLSGKILGPIGLSVLLWQGVWPLATLVLCITNDLLWWVPFLLYLHDAWPHSRHSLREG